MKSATHNPVYGAFAVVVGLLIWINYLSRFTLFVAAWTVTAPFDTDVRPSGTADPAMAVDAGIPVQYTSDDPDNVATTAGNGAPSPLIEALNADPAKANGEAGTRKVRLTKPVNLHKEVTYPGRSGQESAKAAGYFGLGVIAAGAAGVAWSALKTVREVVRRN